MDTISLDVQARNKELSAKEVRQSGLIPAEYYGKGIENVSLQMEYHAFRRAFKAAGSNTLMTLKLDGKDELNVLVHEVKLDPVTDKIVHVDFANIIMGQELQTKIPLEFTGVSFAVKDLKGTLVTHLSDVEVKCLPRDLVHSILVPLESLEDFHCSIKVSDLTIPETLTLVTDLDEMVASVSAPREEEEEISTEGGEAGIEADAEEGGEAGEGATEGEEAAEGEEKSE